MFKKLLQNHLARQLLGGLAGMAVATLVYVVLQQVSLFGNNRAMLVDTPTIAGSSGEVRVNDANADPNELRRVAGHARDIETALAPSDDVTTMQEPSPIEEQIAASSPMTPRAERLALIRSQHETGVSATATAQPSQTDRIAFRNAYAASLRAQETRPAAPAVFAEGTPTTSLATQSTPLIVTDRAPTQVLTQATALPSSGLALNFLVFVSLFGALLHLHPVLRRRLLSTLRVRFQ